MTNELIAGDLLSIGAVFFRPDEPFIWASGIKSPDGEKEIGRAHV